MVNRNKAHIDDDIPSSMYCMVNNKEDLPLTPDQHDALLIIDVQNDFCPGGALEVPDGDRVVEIINTISPAFQTIVLTQDWHPNGHASFATSHNAAPFSTTTLHYGEQTLWPDHCVQGTEGAEFHSKLHSNNAAMIIRKGMHQSIDSYSAFFENDQTTSTGLTGYLKQLGIKRVFCTGLAFDYCVRFTAEDAVKENFKTVVIEDACRAIDMDGSANAARESYKASGITLVQSNTINAKA